jgi:hypothetical protein
MSPIAGDLIPLIARDGRNVGVVIAKATFRVQGAALELDEAQGRIAFADEFVGEPGKSPMRVASDLVDYKPSTDVVVIQPAGGTEKSPLRGRKIKIEVGEVEFSGRVGKEWPFGPVRRDDKARRKLAGTYDEAWVEERMPLLPRDFDPRFNQVAPPGQVSQRYLRGDEHVRISNLYQEHEGLEFHLPGRTALVSGNVLSRYFTEVPDLDTVLIWSDQPRLALVWRLAIPTRQKIEEVRNVFLDFPRIRSTRELYGKP